MCEFVNLETLQLLSEVKSGVNKDEAFSELVRRYDPLMQKKVAGYFGAPASNAREAMQEARIALHSAALSYDVEKSESVTFGLFASVCIDNRLKSLIRESAKRSEREALTDESERMRSAVNIESYIATKDLCARVMSVAKSVLSEFEYEVFRLSFEQYSTKDIADKLERDSKAVDNAKSRISKKLSCDLRIREFFSIIN